MPSTVESNLRGVCAPWVCVRDRRVIPGGWEWIKIPGPDQGRGEGLGCQVPTPPQGLGVRRPEEGACPGVGHTKVLCRQLGDVK